MLNLFMKRKSLPPLLLGLILAGSLGCSVGSLLVQVPTPTPQPTKTPRPTFTFTPNWTPTPLPTPTITPTPIPPTVTPTPEATQTPTAEAEPPTATSTPAPPTNTPAPQLPTDTPTPAPPTATPAPEYPFVVKNTWTHDTGSAVEARITAHVIEVFDESTGRYNDLFDYQILLIDPLGAEHLSNLSGGKNHSTGPGLGDDHWFNTEVKVSPYLPGVYRAKLVKGGIQQSPEVEFTLASSPFQYVHLDFWMYQ
jgi:hypothetical protein